jgi:hypothetical protein
VTDFELSGWLVFAEVVVLVVGGGWALYIYATTRRGQAKVGIGHSARLLPDFAPGRALLIVNLTFTNTSNVLWRHDWSLATLFDARKLAADGTVRLVQFSQADPFLPVYGSTAEDPDEIVQGRPFSYFEDQRISLEPGETVESELAFPLDAGKLGLMALKVTLSGRQRNLSRAPYEWAAFFYIDPEQAGITMESS